MAKKIDVRRETFTETIAAKGQKCSCGCGQRFEAGATIYERPFIQKGKETGRTRLIDLEEHYRQWIDNVTAPLARMRAKTDPKFRDYLGGDE